MTTPLVMRQLLVTLLLHGCHLMPQLLLQWLLLLLLPIAAAVTVHHYCHGCQVCAPTVLLLNPAITDTDVVAAAANARPAARPACPPITLLLQPTPPLLLLLPAVSARHDPDQRTTMHEQDARAC